MRSFFFIKDPMDLTRAHKIIKSANSLSETFEIHNRGRGEDAKQMAICLAIENYKDNYFGEGTDSLTPYLASLARTIMKGEGRSKKDILVDIIEVVNADPEVEKQYSKVEYEASKDNMLDAIDIRILYLALENMEEFLNFAESCITKDTSNNFSKSFKEECCKIADSISKVTDTSSEGFIDKCIMLYERKRDHFRLMLQSLGSKNWLKYNPNMIQKKKSNRFTPIRYEEHPEFGFTEEIDLDNESWYVSSSNKFILKFSCEELYKKLEDYIFDESDSNTNPLRCNIDDTYICKTLGGTFSDVNPNLHSWLEIQKGEVVTNILKRYSSRLLGQTSKNVYVLSNDIPDEIALMDVVLGVEITIPISVHNLD